MQKIISLFQRNYDVDRIVRNEVVPGAEWVIAGEGIATQKLDGTCCLVRDGKLYKRYQIRKGKKAPVDFEAAGEVDKNTGKQQGWVPVGDGLEDKWHREAKLDMLFGSLFFPDFRDGTYELCGPRVQGNLEKLNRHMLFRHSSLILSDNPRTFDGLREYFQEHDIEGIVWHHHDGRMVKVKGKDFGIERGKS